MLHPTEFSLTDTIALLSRTPAAVNGLLRHCRGQRLTVERDQNSEQRPRDGYSRSG
jgi:hypothetical protein